MIRVLVAFLTAALCCTQAWAQQAVRQSGSITPHHLPTWITQGIIGDGGTAANPGTNYISSIGVQASGLGICQYSDAITAVGYQRICMGVTTAGGGQIAIDHFGTATAQPFQLVVNGVASVLATEVGPFAANDVACFQNSAGVLYSCVGGVPVSSLSLTQNYMIVGDASNKGAAVTFSAGFDQGFCSTNGAWPVRVSGIWQCSTVADLTATLFGVGADPSLTHTSAAAFTIKGPTPDDNALAFGVSLTSPHATWIQAKNWTVDNASHLFLNSAGGGVGVNVTPSGLGTGLTSGIQLGDNWTNASPYTNPGSAAVGTGSFTSFTGVTSWATTEHGVLGIALQSYAYANNAALTGAWGYYTECHRITNLDNCSGIEIAALNRYADAVQFDPFSTHAAVNPLGLDCGVGGRPYTQYTCDVAIIIQGSSKVFTTGIAIKSGSLDTSGGPGHALVMADNNGLFWYTSAGVNSVSLYSNTTNLVATHAGSPVFVAGAGATGIQFNAYGAGVLITSTLGVISALAGTTTSVLHGNAAGSPSFASVVSADLNITTTTCTNQFVTAISSGAVGTCTTATLASAQFANQGTTTTLLHGNAAGNPSWTAVVSADLNITTTTCTNQFLTAISATGTGTCTTDTLAGAQHANQGTTTTVLHGNGAGNPSWAAVVSADLNITTTTCTNQFLTAISATGTGTCTTATLASAQFANQGTTTTVLHGNGAGNPSFGAVSLTADITGVLAGVNGGTGLSTAAIGDIIYASATTPTWSRLADVATGSVLVSGGVNTAPAWSAAITVTTSVTTAALAGTTSTTSPLLIGGSGTTGTQLTLKTTTGNGTTDAFAFVGGNNGGTTFGTWSAALHSVVATNVVFGTTASLSVGGNADGLQNWGSTAATGGFTLGMANTTAGTAAHVDFYRSKNATIGSATVVASGDDLGDLTWYGAQQTGTFATQTIAAQIRAEVDGTVTSGAGADMPGRLVFLTTPDGSGTQTERLRIDSAGAATFTSAAAGALTVGRLGATTPAFQVDASTATSITGIKIKSAAAGGGVAVSAIGETNVNLTIDAAGSGTINIGETSTGDITLHQAAFLDAGANITHGIEQSVDSSAENPWTVTDTAASGLTWLLGPAVGTGSPATFAFYSSRVLLKMFVGASGAADVVTVPSTLAATSKTAASLVVGGGIGISGTIYAALAQSTAADVVCYAVSTGLFTYEPTGTTCTVSGEQFKDVGPRLSSQRMLDIALNLDIRSFHYNERGRTEKGTDSSEHWGSTAQRVAAVEPKLAIVEQGGFNDAIKINEMWVVWAGAIKQLKADNDNLRAELEEVKRKVAR